MTALNAYYDGENVVLDKADNLIIPAGQRLIVTILDTQLEAVPKKRGLKLGIAEGKYNIPDDIDAMNDEIAEMFGV